MKKFNTILSIQSLKRICAPIGYILLLMLVYRPSAGAQCANDVTPPVAVCDADITLDVPPVGSITVEALDIDDGSYDLCSTQSALQFFIEEGPLSPTPPATTQLSFTSAQAGPHTLYLWVIDSVGNAANCATNVVINNCQASPVMVCNDMVQVALGPFDCAYEFVPSDMLEGGPYCNYFTYLVELDPNPSGPGTPSPSITFGLADTGQHIMKVLCLETGNACWGTVIIKDVIPPVAVCEVMLDLVLDPPAISTDTLTVFEVDDGSYDNCSAVEYAIQVLDTSMQSLGPFAPYFVFDAGMAGNYWAVLRVTDHAGNTSTCITAVSLEAPVTPRTIEGVVFSDANDDCTYQDLQETGLAGWVVRATGLSTGEIFEANTDAQGHYQMSFPAMDQQYNLALAAPYNYGWLGCPTTYLIDFSNPATGDTVEQNISVHLDQECPLMFVDIATPKIRPCFPGTYYLSYANASAQSISNTYIEVVLDPALAFQSSSIPEIDLGNNEYRFATGTLAPGESGMFSINFTVNCNVQPGATHCSEAHIYPDTLCPDVPLWSGANVEVEGRCTNDTVFLTIRNTGAGANAQPLEFVVVEDVLMREMNTFSLGSGQEITLTPIEGNGATFRLSAQQEPGHPYGGMPSVAVEGCGGFTQGMVMLFQNNNANPFISVFCRENTAAYDPNDKQAVPRGYDDEHWIEPNVPIDYMVRFQNTGTDTAFKVVIVDTLSALLDAKRVRPGSASHPYSFELLDDHILQFTFESILLPDSNTNLEASQGFVQFSIPQMPGNPDGSLITNSAAIYFDFNVPVITNETYHTVGQNFILVSANDPAPGAGTMLVYPNPATDRVWFAPENTQGKSLQFVLTDANGRKVMEQSVAQWPFMLERRSLNSGTYFYHFSDRNSSLYYSGKIMIK